jgi:hypothetical protein
MAIAYVNGSTATQATSSTKSLTLSVPSGVANTNLMIVGGVVDSATATLSTTSGWTQLFAVTKGTCTAAAWYRVASSEPSSYTWSWTATGVGAYVCGSWSGVNSGTVVEAYSGTGISYLSGTVSTPSGTPSQADWMLAIYTDQRSGTTGTTWSTPSGLTARSATSVIGTAVEASIAFFDTAAAVTAGTAYSYASTPTSGTASVVSGIVGIMPPFTGVMPLPVNVRQAVMRAATW